MPRTNAENRRNFLSIGRIRDWVVETSSSSIWIQIFELQRGWKFLSISRHNPISNAIKFCAFRVRIVVGRKPILYSLFKQWKLNWLRVNQDIGMIQHPQGLSFCGNIYIRNKCWRQRFFAIVQLRMDTNLWVSVRKSFFPSQGAKPFQMLLNFAFPCARLCCTNKDLQSLFFYNEIWAD